MSEYAESVRSSRVSSILKTPIRFQLHLSKNLRNIIQQHINGESVREYENLVVSIRDAELLDSDIRELLSEASHCISLLNKDLRFLVEAILSIKWAHRSEAVVSEYRSFILNLLSAHNYHARYAIDKLVFNFFPTDDDEWPDGIPTDEDYQKCVNIHSVFNVLLKVIPMCKELLLKSLRQNFPFYKKSTHTHEYYLHNLLWILDYQPQLRLEILNLIISKLVVLDVNAPKEEIERAEGNDMYDDAVFKMDVDGSDESKSRLTHPVGHTLDVCMDKLLNYIIMECHNTDTGEVDWNKTKGLYQDIISAFDKIILPTYNLHHVQFIMFLLCSFKTAIAEAFLNYLWKKVCTPNTASVIRQTSVGYIASFIARATVVPLSMLKGTIQQMAEWVHSYISAQDELECINSDVRVHTVFYSVCQAVFYVIAFRQSDLVKTRKNIAFLNSLNLGKIVTCRLNPLRKRVLSQQVITFWILFFHLIHIFSLDLAKKFSPSI
ncbi:RNA polymerase I specific transcription initiation factor RRN3 [Popillia japonica]|uniref:RNA polymerase I specific transcription initiation factor RRN3 n=1 Tax=Popillia japonica TaxID=7064 RepID=A0AAW1HTP0_POPJA